MCQPRLLDWSLDTPAVEFRRRIPIRRASATRGLLQGVDIMPQCGMCRIPHKSSGSYWKMCSRCSTPVENLATKSPWTYNRCHEEAWLWMRLCLAAQQFRVWALSKSGAGLGALCPRDKRQAWVLIRVWVGNFFWVATAIPHVSCLFKLYI